MKAKIIGTKAFKKKEKEITLYSVSQRGAGEFFLFERNKLNKEF